MESICRACRGCLESGSIEMVDQSQHFDCSVWEMMYDCTQIDVTIDDGFPSKLCLDCSNRLETCYSFVAMCRESMEFFMANSEDRNLGPDEATNVDPASLVMVSSSNAYSHSSISGDNQSFSSQDHSESEERFESDSLLIPMNTVVDNEISSERKTRSKGMVQPKAVGKKRHKPTQFRDPKERNRLRTMMWRANRTPEQLLVDREKNRIRTAMTRKARRGNQSPCSEEQSESGDKVSDIGVNERTCTKQGKTNRVKSTSWRANQTPEQIVAEREKNRRRIAMIREAKRNNPQGLERERLENRLIQAMRRATRTTEGVSVDRKRRVMDRKTVQDSDGPDSS